MTRFSLMLGAFLFLTSTMAFCQDLPTLDSWEYGSQVSNPLTGYDEIGITSQDTNQPNFGGQGPRGRGMGPYYQGFLLTENGYELVMIGLGKEKGMLRIGQNIYGLTSIQMERSEESTDTEATTETETTEKTVVGQFQASLVAMDSDNSSTTASAIGTIQGILIKYPAPNHPVKEQTTQSNSRPRPPHHGPMVLQATVQASEFSGTILALPQHHPKLRMGGRQGNVSQ